MYYGMEVKETILNVELTLSSYLFTAQFDKNLFKISSKVYILNLYVYKDIHVKVYFYTAGSYIAYTNYGAHFA